MDIAEFDWKTFQEEVGYTDEELEIFKSDPRRAGSALRMRTPEFRSKCMIVEVVSSENCRAGMKVGNRLLIRRLSVIDLERSDPWCIFALGNLRVVAGISHEKWVNGSGLKDLNFDHIQCSDCGVKNGGWGRVVMKAYVKDVSEL